MLKEMQLTLTILVLCCCFFKSSSYPTTNPTTQWRQSRFIIDNRRNVLFSNKNYLGIPQHPAEDSRKKFTTPKTFNATQSRRLYPVDSAYPIQRDLSAEASIDTGFYQKYNTNSLPPELKIDGGVVEHDQRYRVSDYDNVNNSSGYEYDPQNFIQSEDTQNVLKYSKLGSVKDVNNQRVSVNGEVLTWPPKLDKNVLISVSSSAGPTSKLKPPYVPGREDYLPITLPGEFESQKLKTTTSFPWGYNNKKREEGNIINKNNKSNEKHVYETRIETVSYHQEVIFNPQKEPKRENWLSTEHTTRESYEQPTKTYEDDYSNDTHHERNYEEVERNYEEPEKNYEQPEENYEEPERNYEEPEKTYKQIDRSYEEPQINYEQQERNYKQSERRYEQQEKNYEEPERNYEEPERNYEEPERNYEEPERNYEEPERNYEEPERNYEEPERNYEQPEKNYEVDEAISVMTNGRYHGPTSTESQNEENKNKFGYVVEGTNFRKYRVEERTPDGFIVGEYGVVSHDDGSLRGVRYTADGTTNPQLIYDTLLKFLSL